MRTQSSTTRKSEYVGDQSVPTQLTPKESPPMSYKLQSHDKAAKDSKANASWRSLFAFTSRQHTGHIACALVASISAGCIRPTSSIFYGKVFFALTTFGAGGSTAPEMMHEVSKWCLALTALSVASWIVDGVFWLLWVVFGELQAKNARQAMFSGMLDKDMEWYDLRENGISPLLIRIET
jgi:ATP-binding cassette subfamily B (MDR/TAP) protein 1